MLSEKPWREEAVIRLVLVVVGGGVGLSLFAMLLGTMAGRAATDAPRPVGLAFGTIAIQLAAMVMVHFFLREHGLRWREFLGVRGPRLGRGLLLAVTASCVIVPGVMLVNWGSGALLNLLNLKPELQQSIRILRVTPGLAERIQLAVMSMVTAPLIEEIMFRGILYPTIKRAGFPRAALFGTALAFASIHVNLMTLLPLTLLGIAWALLYEFTDNLMAPILAHSLFNAVNFFAVIYQTELSRFLPFLK